MKTHKELIKYFWDGFGGKKTKGKKYSRELKEEIVKLFSKIILIKNDHDIGSKRRYFSANKYDIHNMEYYDNCFICLEKGDVRHHLIQLGQGGSNDKRNIITLCNSCHIKIHPWMTKYYSKKKYKKKKPGKPWSAQIRKIKKEGKIAMI